jgi:hypothetical protein
MRKVISYSAALKTTAYFRNESKRNASTFGALKNDLRSDRPFRPSESSVSLLDRRRYHPRTILLDLASRSERVAYCGIALWVSRSHLAVGHFLGSVVFPQQASPVTVK